MENTEQVLKKLYPNRKFSFTPMEVMEAMDEYGAIWKEKAEVLIEALEKIVKAEAYGYNSGTIQTIATAALQSYTNSK